MKAFITSLVGETLETGPMKWSDSVRSEINGHVYGVPSCARRVLKFCPRERTHALVGPDLGDGFKWVGGTADGKGRIYCIPHDWLRRGVLEIDTRDDTVRELALPLPERGVWTKGALGGDGCLYFVPLDARRVLRLDTDNGAVASVGTDYYEVLGYDLGEILGGRRPYWGAVLGHDSCVYWIPFETTRILKYDPESGLVSFVGKRNAGHFRCRGNGALARDGCIYAVNQEGRVLRIRTRTDDSATDAWEWVGNQVGLHCIGNEWGDAVVGNDGCVYWPPLGAGMTLKYDPHIARALLIPLVVRNHRGGYGGGTLASDGVIYCLPLDATRVLAIDPFAEVKRALATNMAQYPRELGRLFRRGEGGVTFFDAASAKFGEQKVLQALASKLPPADEVMPFIGLHPFLVAALCSDCALSVLYYLLRRAPCLTALGYTGTDKISLENGRMNKKHKSQ